MQHYRTWAYSLIGVVLAILAGFIERAGGVNGAGLPLQMAFGITAGLGVLLVVGDTVYHAWQGKGEACPHCGHLRRMASFRVYTACPGCGR